MKTPREILLQRHASATPKLDRIRQRVLAEESEALRAHKSTPTETEAELWSNFIAKVWLELVWPCRRAWLGLGAIWLIILTLNFASAENRPPSQSKLTPLSPSALALLREQRRLTAELTEPVLPPGGEKPNGLPSPRTHLQQSRLQLA